ncbi:hypothetical protein JL721_8255 [Aureococcus anophagefferens]|nr:hypothetical protein JL721_8255 [Aureococcus anophagefferens]
MLGDDVATTSTVVEVRGAGPGPSPTGTEAQVAAVDGAARGAAPSWRAAVGLRHVGARRAAHVRAGGQGQRRWSGRRRRRPRLSYFGQQAKREFFDLYKSMARQAEIVDDVGARVVGEERGSRAWSAATAASAARPASQVVLRIIKSPGAGGATGVSDEPQPAAPAARGIAAMMKRLRRPGDGGDRSACGPLFVRRAASDGLDLAHRAYGDDLAILLADMITAARAAAAQRARQPANVLDGAAIDSLARFLETEACALEELHLDGADVDDGAAQESEIPNFKGSYLGRFPLVSADFWTSDRPSERSRSVDVFSVGAADPADAVAKNATLKTLALSGSFLGGAAEKLANCAPGPRRLRGRQGFRTSGVAGPVVEPAGSAVRVIDRRRAREEPEFSLVLAGLQLHRRRGRDGFGRALDANGTIQHLDVSSNGIRNRGAQVIAEGLRDNLRLTRLDMSGNPVGALGGRALLASLNYSRRPRHIELGGCELSGDGAPGRFNPATPQGHYDLDLDDPFQWMVAKQLIWLSVTRAGAKFRSLVEIDASSGGKPTKRGVTLVSRTPEADKPGAIGWEPGKKDASGTISTAEFAEFVDKGDAAFFVKSPKKAKPAGFHAIVRQQSVKLQVDDGKMTKAAALLQSAPPRLRRPSTPSRSSRPASAGATSSVARALIVADYAGVRESAAGGTAANLLKVGDRIALVRLAAVDLRIFAMQLQHFLDRLMQSARPLGGGEIVDFFVCLLPRVVDVHSVAGLVQRNLSEAQTAHLWAKLGPAMPVFAGAVAARHDFDLTQPLHRAALCKLVQMDQIFVAQQRGHFGDDGGGLTFSVSASAGGDLSQLCRGGTSQNSDYRGFRNATLNGDPISSAEIEALTATFGDAGADAPTLKGKAQLSATTGFLRADGRDRDLAGSFKAPEAADADGFKAWLDKRRVPRRRGAGELDAALRQLKAREAHWACDLVPALTGRKKKAARHDDFAAGFEKGRASLPLGLETRARDDEEAAPPNPKFEIRTAEDPLLNRAAQRVAGSLRKRVSAALRKGELPLVESFVTSDIRVDEEGSVLLSPANTAARSVFACAQAAARGSAPSPP